MNIMGGFTGGRRSMGCGAKVLLAVVALGTVAVRADTGSFFSRLMARDVEVITVTDMTDAGRLLRQPSRQHPVYYEALILGYTDFGRSIAGLKEPDKNKMLKLILKLLADRGYYPANAKHAPEMLIALRWGTLNQRPGMALPFMGGDKLDMLYQLERMSPSNMVQYMTSFRHGPIGDFVSSCADGDLYVISVMVFDEAEALKGNTKLLWHTKVSCPANGLDIEPTLRQMARQAAPMFGRETAKPVWTITTEREGHVELGEMRIVEEIQTDKLPITDATKPDARAEKKK